MKLTLDKSGAFQTWFISGDEDRKCGLPDTSTFNYSVKIEGTDARLSAEGFLVENSRIQQYFDKTYKKVQPVKSCERIACDAARALGEMIRREGRDVVSVTVTISGTPGANLTAIWKNHAH